MSLELHVWGPAFGLPSIDAECLAAIAYLRECLPQGSWTLVASAGDSQQTFEDLPALKDGGTWVSGYRAIVQYLRAVNRSWNLDDGLSSTEAADCIAYTSFLESRGQPLVDLSLFVSSENYSACTSPALSKLLAWPSSWFVPHRLREKARKTSEHLGLSGLDVDSAQEEKSDDGMSASIPKSLRKPRQTVSALLGHDTKRSKFRLDAVTSDFLAPLDELLSNGEWLITEHATSVDCLALGYLALMQIPDEVPQPWLRDALAKKYPKLGRWARKREAEWFPKRESSAAAKDRQKLASGAQNGDVATNAEFNTSSEQHELPWKTQGPTSIHGMINSLVLNVVRAVPTVGVYLRPVDTSVAYQQSQQNRRKQKQATLERLRARELWYSQVLSSSILAVIISGVLAYNGILRLPNLRARPTTRRFGEAGAMLGLI